nr:hypothetical protein [Lentilactobacillus sp. SPB1-3]MCZ0976463.1 hypothetical protein [Lentilactobacillus sp. SPB1-3]
MNKFKKAAIITGLVFTVQTAGSAVVLPPVVSNARTTYVWIAPYQGRKYHYSRGCRGLNRARSTRHVTLHWAKSHRYKLCGWE